MTEQPVEPMTEQQFLGHDKMPAQAYLPNGHRLPKMIVPTLTEADLTEALAMKNAAIFTLSDAEATFTKHRDLWLDAEEQTTRALAEIQDGNINAGIACLQSALAFAQNYRHSLTEEIAR